MTEYSVELLRILEDIKNQRKLGLERFKNLITEERVIALTALGNQSKKDRKLLHKLINKNDVEHGIS